MLQALCPETVFPDLLSLASPPGKLHPLTSCPWLHKTTAGRFQFCCKLYVKFHDMLIFSTWWKIFLASRLPKYQEIVVSICQHTAYSLSKNNHAFLAICPAMTAGNEWGVAGNNMVLHDKLCVVWQRWCGTDTSEWIWGGWICISTSVTCWTFPKYPTNDWNI